MRGSHRTGEFIDLFTRDFSGSDFQRLFTHDTREAYRFFSHHIDEAAFNELSLVKRLAVKTRLFFLAFTVKLSPARRALFGLALVAAFIGALQLFDGFGLIQTSLPLFPFNIRIPGPVWADGTLWLLSGFVLINLLVLLEVADRLTLKNELEVARDIQLAMLPHHTYSADGVEAEGWTRPANTVGGDFYDVLPLRDGRLIVALGDVAGKGSPAALLMALLLAMLRTLVTEGLPPSRLVERLNQLVHQQTPGSRFITLFLGVFDPTSGELTYVNAGQTPPLLLSGDRADRLLTAAGSPWECSREPSTTLDGGLSRQATCWSCTATASQRQKTLGASRSMNPVCKASRSRFGQGRSRSSVPRSSARSRATPGLPSSRMTSRYLCCVDWLPCSRKIF